MRATWRAMSAISIPQASGSSNARRSATCSPPSTIAARSTSTPPCSSAVGGMCSASKIGKGSFMSGIGSFRLGDGRDLGRALGRLADRLLERRTYALDRLVLAEQLLVRVDARDMARRIDEHQSPRGRVGEAAHQREM